MREMWFVIFSSNPICCGFLMVLDANNSTEWCFNTNLVLKLRLTTTVTSLIYEDMKDLISNGKIFDEKKTEPFKLMNNCKTINSLCDKLTVFLSLLVFSCLKKWKCIYADTLINKNYNLCTYQGILNAFTNICFHAFVCNTAALLNIPEQ